MSGSGTYFARGADDSRFRANLSITEAVKKCGQQLAAREVAGPTENYQVEGGERVSQAEINIIRVIFSKTQNSISLSGGAQERGSQCKPKT